jgi:hypothetical protein
LLKAARNRLFIARLNEHDDKRRTISGMA